MDTFIEKCLSRGEMGDAELFVNLLQNDYCYDCYTHTWYKWGGHCWKGSGGVLSVVDEVVKVYEKETCKAREMDRIQLRKRITILNTRRRRVDVIKLAEDILSQHTDIKWDSKPWLLPCVNGVINLRSGELVSGTPEDYQRSCCPTTYRGLKVICPRWDEFLLQIMDGSTEMADYIQRLVGYAISGTAGEGVFPVLWGRGRNGKGTMLEVLAKVLGDFATPIPSSLLMEQTYTRSSAAPSPDLMRLMGKRLVWANETDEDRKLSTSMVKWLVGGDTIVARPLHGNEVTFQPTHTMFMLTNHKPKVEANDYALWQRLHLIPFTLSFVDNPVRGDERKRDLDLMRRFTRIEDQGILAWAVRGCLEWQEWGLCPPQAVTGAVQAYIAEEDYVSEFLRDETTPGDRGEWVRALAVYQCYRVWAQERGIHPVTMTKFGRDMTEKVTKRKQAAGYEYRLSLKQG